VSYESTANPIKVGYVMDFVLPAEYPQDRRLDLKASGVGRQNGIAGFEQYFEVKSVACPAR
jgi:hypothetical protein